MTSAQYKAILQLLLDRLEESLLENVKLRQLLEQESIPNIDERLRSVELGAPARKCAHDLLELFRCLISEETGDKVSAALLKGIPILGKPQ